MLTIYKTTEQGLEQLDSMANGTWVKAVDPTPEEIQKLVAEGQEKGFLSYDEIAEISGLPLGTVKNRLFRAREMMREIFIERGFTGI